MLGWGILTIIAFLIIATWPARVASSKGHGFWGWFILSIPFWFVTIFWVYFGLDDKTKTAQDIAAEKAVDKILAKEEKEGK